jgi:biotin carboxylase
MKVECSRQTTILIVGAGPNQLPAIQMARQRGLRVVAIDGNPRAQGFAHADAHGVISTRDVEGAIAFARSWNQNARLDGVMTMASESAVTVAGIAKALKLPGLDPQAALRASQKILRQRCFHRSGVPSPRFLAADSARKAIQLAAEIGWPVVVKPADGAGSRAVQKVNSPKEMSRAVQEIAAHSKTAQFLIEEFLIGSEHSIEGIVIGGEIYWTGFSDRNYDKKEIYPPFFLEDGDTLPTRLSPDMVEKVKTAAAAAVRALGIDWGPVKGDILIDREGPRVLEMAARLSGDYFCNETVPLHSGVNVVAAVMALSLGECVDARTLAPKFERGVALRYVWPKPGKVTAIRGIDRVRAMPGVHFFRWEPRWSDIGVGSLITPARSMGERVGSVMASGENRAEAVERAEAAVRTIEIITEVEKT